MIEESVGLSFLQVNFNIHFPDGALVDAISAALARNVEKLLPPPAMRELGTYVRLWATHALETELGCSAREALHEWNRIVIGLWEVGIRYSKGAYAQGTPPLTQVTGPKADALLWNLEDAEGATVGSGETQYSRTKEIIGQRIVALSNVFQRTRGESKGD